MFTVHKDMEVNLGHTYIKKDMIFIDCTWTWALSASSTVQQYRTMLLIDPQYKKLFVIVATNRAYQ